MRATNRNWVATRLRFLHHLAPKASGRNTIRVSGVEGCNGAQWVSDPISPTASFHILGKHVRASREVNLSPRFLSNISKDSSYWVPEQHLLCKIAWLPNQTTILHGRVVQGFS